MLWQDWAVLIRQCHAGGAWGTALAIHASARHETVVYARETDVVEAINDPAVRENTTFLKVGLSWPDSLLWGPPICRSCPQSSECRIPSAELDLLQCDQPVSGLSVVMLCLACPLSLCLHNGGLKYDSICQSWGCVSLPTLCMYQSTKARCRQKTNGQVVQGHKVPEGLRATGSMAEAVEHAEVILMVVPTQFVARTMTDLAKLLKPNQVRSPLYAALAQLFSSSPAPIVT